MPAAVVAVEPGSGRVLAANRAARELSGEDPVGRPATAWLPVERCRDADGRPLAEEQLPAVRAARGERIRGAAVACDTPLGERTLRVSAETVDGVALVTCEDVTELRAAQLGERLVGDDLRAIIEGIADAVTAQGPDGSLVYANDAAVRVLGFSSAEALLSAPMAEIMARWELLTPTGEPHSLMSLPGRKALMGEEPEPMLVQFRERGGQETRWSRIKARPVRDPDGVRAARHQRDRGRHRAQAGRAGAALPRRGEPRARRLARLRGHAGHDRQAGGPERGRLVRRRPRHRPPARGPARGGRARRSGEGRAGAGARRPLPAPRRAATAGSTRCCTTGESQLWPHIPDALIVEAAQDEEHLRMIRELGMSSAMIVPMRVRDRVLGAISFVSAESGRTFNPGDLRLAEDLALRAGDGGRERPPVPRALDDRRRRCRPRCCRRCCPRSRASTPARSTRPAGEGHEVGGDFYDLFATGEGQWFAVIGDVCGKGAEAAAVTALARYTIRAAAARRRSPAAILRWVNDAMVQTRARRASAPIALRPPRPLQRARDRVTVAAAGTRSPIVLRADGTRRGARHARHAARARRRTPSSRTRRPSCAAATRSCSTPTALTEAGAPQRVWTPEELADGRRRRRPAAARRQLVDHVADAALRDLGGPPRDDVALLALRLTP